MSGNSIEKQWQSLSSEEKLQRLEPRINLILSMICDVRDNVDKNLLSENFKKGLEVLNLAKD